MYELTVERTFCAAHSIRINGEWEPRHGHNWHVRATVRAESLDKNDLVCDFHLIERRLEAILKPLHNADLNDTPPFDSINPTAERVAQHIYERLREALPAKVHLDCVRVEEAPGCVAAYRAD